MKAGRAFGAGVVGAIVMSIIMAMARAMGMQAQLEMLLGTMIMPPGQGAFWLGMMMHLMMGGIFGLVYAWGFTAIHRTGWTTGLAFGALHSIAAGVFMGVIPIAMNHPGEHIARNERLTMAASSGQACVRQPWRRAAMDLGCQSPSRDRWEGQNFRVAIE